MRDAFASPVIRRDPSRISEGTSRPVPATLLEKPFNLSTHAELEGVEGANEEGQQRPIVSAFDEID